MIVNKHVYSFHIILLDLAIFHSEDPREQDCTVSPTIECFKKKFFGNAMPRNSHGSKTLTYSAKVFKCFLALRGRTLFNKRGKIDK